MDVYEARRRLLVRLVETRFEGSQVKFATEAQLQPSYVSRMLKAPGEPGQHKRIGEDKARELEEALELPAGTLVHPSLDRLELPTPPPAAAPAMPQHPWPLQRITPAEWAALSEADRIVIDWAAFKALRDLRAPSSAVPAPAPQQTATPIAGPAESDAIAARLEKFQAVLKGPDEGSPAPKPSGRGAHRTKKQPARKT